MKIYFTAILKSAENWLHKEFFNILIVLCALTIVLRLLAMIIFPPAS